MGGVGAASLEVVLAGKLGCNLQALYNMDHKTIRNTALTDTLSDEHFTEMIIDPDLNLDGKRKIRMHNSTTTKR